jgi:hypothetical protein
VWWRGVVAERENRVQQQGEADLRKQYCSCGKKEAKTVVCR